MGSCSLVNSPTCFCRNWASFQVLPNFSWDFPVTVFMRSQKPLFFTLAQATSGHLLTLLLLVLWQGRLATPGVASLDISNTGFLGVSLHQSQGLFHQREKNTFTSASECNILPLLPLREIHIYAFCLLTASVSLSSTPEALVDEQWDLRHKPFVFSTTSLFFNEKSPCKGIHGSPAQKFLQRASVALTLTSGSVQDSDSFYVAAEWG